MALKNLGVPVEMVRYPSSSHGLSRTGEPWLLVDRLERIRSWFEHWLIEQAPHRERRRRISGYCGGCRGGCPTLRRMNPGVETRREGRS